MCCSVTPGESVRFSNTILYAGEVVDRQDQTVHVLGYQNKVGRAGWLSALTNWLPARTGNAMILPFPAVPGSMTPRSGSRVEEATAEPGPVRRVRPLVSGLDGGAVLLQHAEGAAGRSAVVVVQADAPGPALPADARLPHGGRAGSGCRRGGGPYDRGRLAAHDGGATGRVSKVSPTPCRVTCAKRWWASVSRSGSPTATSCANWRTSSRGGLRRCGVGRPGVSGRR
jgi:hypothetical protein